jgi:hypothetical protein
MKKSMKRFKRCNLIAPSLPEVGKSGCREYDLLGASNAGTFYAVNASG